MSAAGPVISKLRAQGDPRNVAGMARFGIRSRGEVLGVGVTELRRIARPHRGDHRLAEELWASGIHEARILAALVDDPAQVTRSQMNRWAGECDNWAATDACCWALFDRSAFAEEKARQWTRRRGEFVKRCGFVLMAGMAMHRKELPDEVFLGFLPIIAREAGDDRNFVRKAANWALRQIGKRNGALRRAAIAAAEEISRQPHRSARWIAADALRELRRTR